MTTELLKNNNSISCVMVILGSRDTPETNQLLFKVYLPRWKMIFHIGWELKDCIPLSIPQNEYRFYEVRDCEHINNSNEDYWCLFVRCG